MDDKPSVKQAACTECRKSKIRCVRNKADSSCRKCKSSGLDCEIPAYRVGRRKGTKNKHSGLERAKILIKEAVENGEGGTDRLDSSQRKVLGQMLQQTMNTADTSPESLKPPSLPSTVQNSLEPSPKSPPQSIEFLSSYAAPPGTSSDYDEFTVSNAGNPLDLLAIASEIPHTSRNHSSKGSVQKSRSEAPIQPLNASETLSFFRPLQTKLDNSQELDPVSLGLVTESEAKRLFEFFHSNLAHTRWGLVVQIHNPEFVRERSAFLYTSILSSSALFLPDTAALSMRLRNHAQNLIKAIICERYRSLEIVLGFMVNVPWLIAKQQWAADDQTCYFISTALSIALDLSLNKVISSANTSGSEPSEPVSKVNCIEASKVLIIDGLENLDPASHFAKRWFRQRERTWLALFNLDQGVSLARGRPSIVPVTVFIDLCDNWHISDIADVQDATLVAATVMRRGFNQLVNDIKTTCDTSQLSIIDNSSTVRQIRTMVEDFFDRWHIGWQHLLKKTDGQMPPYIEILASHTKLSAYCLVINHPTAPADAKLFFRTAGLASAINVLKVAVRAENRLKSMPNNTVIMVSFAAFFLLGLSNGMGYESMSNMSSAIKLIREVARVLRCLGSEPPHRYGASVWFGKHIDNVLGGFDFDQRAILKNGNKQETHHTQLSTDVNETADFEESNVNAFGPYQQEGSGYQAHLDNLPDFDMSNDEIIDQVMSLRETIDSFTADVFYNDSYFQNWSELWA